MSNTGLDAARAAAAAKRAAGEKIERKTPLQKLADSPLSLRAAVNAKCYQCEGEDADPGVRWRIGNCACASCALHAVRPYQRLAKTSAPASLTP